MAGAQISKGRLAGPRSSRAMDGPDSSAEAGAAGARGALAPLSLRYRFHGMEFTALKRTLQGHSVRLSSVRLSPLSSFHSEGKPPKRPLPALPSL